MSRQLSLMTRLPVPTVPVPALLIPALLFLAALTASPGAHAQPRLGVRQLVFAHPPVRVEVIQWADAPTLLVLSAGGGAPGSSAWKLELALLRLKGTKLVPAARWALPRELRWVEPLRLRGGEDAWFALIGAGWYLGRVKGKALRWKLLCRCETLFSAGKELLPFKAAFVNDLDGDGAPEVLLPHWRGLMAYRLDPGGRLELLWRDRWHIREKYEVRDSRLRLTVELPRYVLKDANGDGVRDFILIGPSHLEVAYHPRPAPPSGKLYYIPDRDKLPELRRLELPPSLLAALEALPPATFEKADAFFQALEGKRGAAGGEAWAPFRKRVLAAIAEPIPAYFSTPVPLPGLGPPGNKEKHEVLAVADMNGDGVLDVVHVKSSKEGGVLEQKNQLRWYRGSRPDGRLAFVDKPQLFFSEGPAFAKLVFPEIQKNLPPALFLATTEVSLLAVIRAFTLNEVSLDLFVYPWREGRLVVPPPTGGSLVFDLKGKDKKNRPMVLLADLNGNGRREYLFNMEADTLAAFASGKLGPDFDEDPLVRTEVVMPLKPDSVLVGDLNGDGREELVLWYPRSKSSGRRRTVRVLQYVAQ